VGLTTLIIYSVWR